MTEYKFRDGVLAIVYRQLGEKVEFLALHRIKNWVGWEISKGGLKPGETHKDAVIRELKEECNIDESAIGLILPTNSNIRIDYPKEGWEKAGYKGAFYNNFLIRLDGSYKLTIEKNDEPEHDNIKWISEDEVATYFEPKLQKAIKSAKKVLESYSKVINLAKNIQASTSSRFVGLLMYGSRSNGKNSDSSDFDLVLILTKEEVNDMSIINKYKKEDMKLDFQLLYLDEIPKSGNFISLDSSGSFTYFNLKNAITVLGSNPWELVEKPDNKQLEISILAKIQYYIYRLRQFTLNQSKNNTDLLYFTKRLLLVIRMVMLFNGTWYLDADDALNDFKEAFPECFTDEDIEKLKSAINTKNALDLGYLYQLYMKIYQSSLSYLRVNSSLVTFNEISFERKI